MKSSGKYRIHPRVVYFLRAGDAIKIGTTIHLPERVPMIERDIGLQVEVIGWIYAGFQTENLIHKRLVKHAEGNEWFADCAEVSGLITYLLEKGPHFQGLPPLPKL